MTTNILKQGIKYYDKIFYFFEQMNSNFIHLFDTYGVV